VDGSCEVMVWIIVIIRLVINKMVSVSSYSEIFQRSPFKVVFLFARIFNFAAP